jgi:biotin carboxyl carrier protein
MPTDGEIAGSLLDPDLLRRVLAQVQTDGIDELEISDASSRLYIKRVPGAAVTGGTRTVAPSSREEPAIGVPIVAPLTGVYYGRAAPDQPPFVAVDADLQVDDVVGLIETMKLFNEVKTEIAGRVVQIVASEGELVQVGQPLIFVAPIEEEA